MLKTIRLNDKRKRRGCALVLGGFDGVHLGHRRLITRAKLSGAPVGVMTILGGKGDALFTLEERLSVFREMGVDFVIPFDFANICEKSAQEFLAQLEEEFSPACYVCGKDFRFGKDAQGDADTITSLSSVPVIQEDLVVVDGEKIATRQLKQLLAEGQVEKMRLLLGYPFYIIGEVVEGRQIGRIIGYPTANILYPAGKIPLKEGVYSVRATWEGNSYKGVANFGKQPTFGGRWIKLEVHLDGFDGNIYGKTLKVDFLSYLRPVCKFGDLEALRKQVGEDLRRVREDD